MIKVLLVDDHTMVRKGIRMLLQAYSDIQIVGECADGNDAIIKTNQLTPDVILLDLSMPGGLDGFATSKEIRKNTPQPKIVLLTMYDEEIYVQQALTQGIDGYILKNSHGETLIDAIRAVFRGQHFYKTSVADDKIKEWMSLAHEQESRTIPSQLTDREKEIVRLTVLGFSNKEMADELSISVKTVENHKTNIMQKLGLTSKRELIQYAIKNKYLDLAF
ncbi:response regulator transcription factor [Brevibacillus dissolubilis]|uniref:response regulator transcription factor n=1 Tax=Brevibacillus dissolubilis TaxID=1844116 RepID=UPI0011177498|nr:response regulator transcription factor [Brevibacillus dissolubilis]